mmetsp:Transcript_173830/g.422781  ORF Transcript_173830/g.422781 Transcript_173830/m.422781 type:complete len:354 (-) Transcript_173830:85-1146(-)
MSGTNAAPVEAAEACQLTVTDYLRKLLLCMVYITVSTVLIRFNKLMMQDDHFPHAMALSAVHTLVTTSCCSAIYLLAPSLMPAMEGTQGSRLDLMKWFVPIGLLFAVTLFGSNQAYLYCSVTFLQFMKESNVIIVFTISCLVGLQMCSRVRVFVLLWIIAGASISVSGEIHFAWLGFAFQAVSQLTECSRNVMGEYLLSGRKFDALTYNMFLAPICFVILVIATCFSWDSRIPTDFAAWWHLLLLNGLVAFSLNFLVASVIKECSAVGFVLCGLCKDIVIVVISSIAFGEEVTHKQSGAFLVTLLGILFWSLMKTHPKSLPVRAAEAMLCVPYDPSEQKMLLPGVPKLAGNKV